jgi:putative hydrolase of the HAD superfamily
MTEGGAPSIRAVAWDFDGVLNVAKRNGRLIWSERFEEDTGHPLAGFQAHVFERDFEAVLTGREDVRERVARWADAVGHAPGPDAILDYWFTRDLRLDAAILDLAERLAQGGVRQAVATNNEPRRVAFLEREAALPRHLPILASGRLGAAKPAPAFFAAAAEALETRPAEILLVDDHPANVGGARAAGWRAFHLTDATRDRLPAALPL